jgi:hypothetical protein
MDASIRKRVRDRGRGRCEYCLLPQTAIWLRFHVEHIIARQHGGEDDVENLALACPQCNSFKGPNLASIDPKTARLTRLFNPRRDAWQRHFALVGAEIIGRTIAGRATVALLQMNSEEMLLLRRELIENNEFADLGA